MQPNPPSRCDVTASNLVSTAQSADTEAVALEGNQRRSCRASLSTCARERGLIVVSEYRYVAADRESHLHAGVGAQLS